MPAKILDQIIRDVRSWPAEDQVELADYARVIKARRKGVYYVSDEERAAIVAGSSRQIGAFLPTTLMSRCCQSASKDKHGLCPPGLSRLRRMPHPTVFRSISDTSGRHGTASHNLRNLLSG